VKLGGFKGSHDIDFGLLLWPELGVMACSMFSQPLIARSPFPLLYGIGGTGLVLALFIT
jgi:hypothetical protein